MFIRPFFRLGLALGAGIGFLGKFYHDSEALARIVLGGQKNMLKKKARRMAAAMMAGILTCSLTAVPVKADSISETEQRGKELQKTEGSSGKMRKALWPVS